MKTFLIVWLGQTISLLGTGLTGFGLGVWVYQETGSVTRFALIAFFTVLPGLLLSPLVGALVDRWNRRRVMICSNLGAGLTGSILALLLWSGGLAIWHIYVLMAIISSCGAFQWPAFIASSTLLVDKRHFGRAGGLTQMGQALGQIVAPVLGGVLLTVLGVWGVVLADVVTYFFALMTLLFVHIPQPEAPAEARESERAERSLGREALYGWTYLRERPGLLALLILFAVANFTLGVVQTLLIPLILSFSTAKVLGTVLSIAGAGMLLGTLTMGVWGGPRRRMHAIFGALAIQGVILMVGGLRPEIALIAPAAFLVMYLQPFAFASSQAIWQSKVTPEVQGRVFAIRRMVAFSSLPLAYFLAGPLADYVFEPLMAPGGALAPTLGAWIGVGEGRGIGLLFSLLGVLLLLALLAASGYQRLRRVEDELPDTIGTEGAEPGASPHLATESSLG